MRWEICFNLSILRMLSFSLDLHWQRQKAQEVLRQGADQCELDGRLAKASNLSAANVRVALTARQRQQLPLPGPADYNLTLYLAYVLYPPLYLAGPIVTFQDFGWQLRLPGQQHQRRVVSLS
jgi:D-alanyl-lipoteichoic acid acyltransferase DltB (MBOAT superfamily)